MLYLPQHIPCAETLRSEGLEIAEYDLHHLPQHEGLTRILLLNLMPQKAVTETDLARMMAHAGIDVLLLPVMIEGQTYKTTPMEHMKAYYRYFGEVASLPWHGMLLTGAPVEHLPFEEVRYWEPLCRIMQWADSHLASTLYICWGAQAGLYHHYGIPKYGLPAKRFGIFRQNALLPQSPLLTGLSPFFLMPHSRHTEVRRHDIEAHADQGLQLLAFGPESGVGLVASADQRRVFVSGHLEYEPYTLHNEYHRDLRKGLPIAQPEHYYDEAEHVIFSWKTDALQFYRNWVLWVKHHAHDNDL